MCVHACALSKCEFTVGIVNVMLRGYWALWPVLGKCCCFFSAGGRNLPTLESSAHTAPPLLSEAAGTSAQVSAPCSVGGSGSHTHRRSRICSVQVLTSDVRPVLSAWGPPVCSCSVCAPFWGSVVGDWTGVRVFVIPHRPRSHCLGVSHRASPLGPFTDPGGPFLGNQ